MEERDRIIAGVRQLWAENRDIDNLKQEIANLSLKLSESETLCQEKCGEIGRLDATSQARQAEIDKLTQEKVVLQDDLRKRDLDIGQLKEVNKDLQSDLKVNQFDIDEKNKTIDKLQSDLQVKQSSLDELTANNKSMQAKIEELEAHKKNLQFDLNAEKAKVVEQIAANNDLNSKLAAQQSEFDTLKGTNDKLQSDLDETKKALEKYTPIFDVINLCPFYSEIPDNIKSDLKVFVKDDTISLLAAGVQGRNLKSLHEFLYRRIIDDKIQNYGSLYKLVRRLFDIYNAGQKEPWKLIEPEIDSDYKSEIHQPKDNGIGKKISELLLFGYQNADGIKKAIVKVK